MHKVISRYALLLVIAAVILLAVTEDLFSSSAVVIAVQILAVGLAIWARRSFPTGAFRVDATPSADTVIRRGPYGLIRHPMYSAALLFIWAAVLSHLSLRTGILGVVVTVVIALRIILEERFLCERYPDYAAYMKVTKAIVPYLI
jgi:protein-S-isoprenylcysteine O-methyltransferase Ste14